MMTVDGSGSDWSSCTLQGDGNGNAVYIVTGKIVERVLGDGQGAGQAGTLGADRLAR